MPKVDPSDPESMKKILAQGGMPQAGPKLFFVTVDESLSRYDIEGLCKKWSTIFLSGNIEVTFHTLDDKQVIGNLPMGSQAFEVRRLLLDQDEVVDVTMDSQTWNKNGPVKK